MKNPFRKNRSKKAPAAAGWIAGDKIDSIELLERAFGEPIAADQPIIQNAELPDGKRLFAEGVIAFSAGSAFQATIANAREESIRLEAAAADAKAKAEERAKTSEGRETSYNNLLVQQDFVLEHLGGRLHAHKISRRWVTLLTLFIVLGEVALNSAAAYLSGDPLFTAIPSFVGIGASVMGLAMLAKRIRQWADNLAMTGEEPVDCPPSLRHWFVKGPSLEAKIIVAVVTTVLLLIGVGVAELRISGYSTPWYAVFSLAIIIGAMSLIYVSSDAVHDLLTALKEEAAQLCVELTIDLAAFALAAETQAKLRAFQESIQAEARAVRSINLATGLAGLMRDPKWGDVCDGNFFTRVQALTREAESDFVAPLHNPDVSTVSPVAEVTPLHIATEAIG